MRPKHLPITIAALALLAVSAAIAERTGDPEFPDFKARVKKYTELVDRLDKEVGRLPDKAEPEQIHAHKIALAEAVRKARAGARRGDIFPAGEEADFRKVLHTETKGKHGAPARKTIAEDNPKGPAKPQEAEQKTPPVKLAVNAKYPDGAPLSTVPPTLLLRLPKLPETVQYRFVGKALVLYDARANLIVDYIPNAL